MGKSKIEWTEMTWNPVTGCTHVSDGCDNCYAERMAKRLAGRAGYPKHKPFAVTMHKDRLRQPFHWRKSRVIFVCSMSDLFHPQVPTEFRYEVFDTMLKADWHTYLLLTKRPARMRDDMHGVLCGSEALGREHIWVGTSVEDQRTANDRIPYLLDINAPRRFISCEPLLGPIHIEPYLRTMRQAEDGSMEPAIQWVIVGGETGPGARPMHPYWVQSLKDQTLDEGACFFFKQWGEWRARPAFEKREAPYVVMNMMGQQVKAGEKGAAMFERVGRKRAGRELDGKLWEQRPSLLGVPAERAAT